MIAKLYALAGLLVLAGVVSADVCRTGHAAYPTQQYADVVVAPAVAVPLYGASYSAGDPETALALQAILDELKAMRADLAALKAGGAPAGAQSLTLPKPDPAKAMTAHCAACHTEGPKLKGDFALFDAWGQLLKLNGPDRRAIEKRTREGTMPPPDKPRPSAEDKAAIAAYAGSTAPPVAKPPEVKK